MKKFLYVFIGMAIALGAVVLYSFKASTSQEASSVIVEVSNSVLGGNDILIYYSDGKTEDVGTVLNIRISAVPNPEKGKYSMQTGISKTLSYLYNKGYKIVSQGQTMVLEQGSGRSTQNYTLIKEN